MRIDMTESAAREIRDFVAGRLDGLLAEIGHTDSPEFRRLLRVRLGLIEEALRAFDFALTEPPPVREDLPAPGA